MKIGIDARFFGTSGKGLGRYTQKLVEELEQVDHNNQYYIFLNKHNFEEYNPKNPNFHKVLADIPWYSWQEQIIFPKILNKYKLDLVHFLHFNVPILYSKPYFVTIHDLILLEYPTRRASKLNTIMYTIKNIAYRLVIMKAIKTSKKIIAISKYTKQSIQKHFHTKDNKIAMIYEGVDLERFNLLNAQEFDFKKFNIEPHKYILYVGNVYPHKNIDKLVDVFHALKQKPDIDKDLKLVLVGKKDYFFENIINHTKNLDLEKSVIFPGYVPDNQLISLYEKSLFYVFPSLYEGFGLPPLEAIALGAPIVISKATCLPEIFGEHIEYFDPKSKDNMQEVLYSFILDNKKRELQKTYHHSILSKYSWLDMAKDTKKLYNEIKI
ncbi:MAG: glycosyltransferase family 1 protein [Candidatus Paceibacterota bacterium]